ncbi:MAG: RhuM family protein [Minisyncoccota bacterium]
MAKKSSKSPGPHQIVIYQAKSGAIKFRGDFNKETIWATQAQIVDLFTVDQSVVSRHIRNVFKDGEIEEKSNMQKMHNAHSDKPVTLYSLDIVLAVGYRTNSKRAIEFRQWATKTLRAHIVDGYTINRSRIAKNYDAFMRAVAEVKALLPAEAAIGDAGILELISFFADTWFSLDAYDRERFISGRTTKKKVALTAESFMREVSIFKSELVACGEASAFFAAERHERAVEGIIGNVMQSFGGKDLYPGIEEKAAHLLYFIVKNHPFVDGNKRTAAYAFVRFLSQAKVLDRERITPSALTALTLLVAESDPKDKERIIGLVTMLLGLPRE